LFRRPEVELLVRMVRAPANHQNADKVATILQRDINWPAFLRHARRHGVLPLVYRYVKAADRLPIPGHVVEQLKKHYLHNSRHNFLKTGILLRILQRLEQAGILAIPYRGPTLAMMAYRDLGLRVFGDLDLQIRRPDLERAREILLDEGFRSAYGLTATEEEGFLRNKGQLPLLLDEQHLIELHLELFHPSFGFKLNHDALEGRLKPVCVAGRSVLTYCPEDLLLILSAHGAKHFWISLGWICDLAELIHAQPTLDWIAMIEAAGAAGGKRMFFLGVFLAREFSAAPVPAEVMSAIRKERTLPPLAAGISRRLFSARWPTAWEKAWFLLHTRDRIQDGLRDLLSRLFILPEPNP